VIRSEAVRLPMARFGPSAGKFDHFQDRFGHELGLIFGDPMATAFGDDVAALRRSRRDGSMVGKAPGREVGS